eukprot:CAMPEP_0175587632 /NCGR_PEP_ID=MMETSP0096-20121207/50861_1 /TAXON_ID=311494 /ORGANISM="Alexandrium monilatum, Strain CCMP3105" /LENGTH=31 /DNA_ID= /DNA_START= /DNA_END= /DNA_ORIENTATION=
MTVWWEVGLRQPSSSSNRRDSLAVLEGAVSL